MNTKSGFPTSLLLRRHPARPARLISAMNACSVVLFPCDLIRDIVYERCSMLRLSAMSYLCCDLSQLLNLSGDQAADVFVW